MAHALTSALALDPVTVGTSESVDMADALNSIDWVARFATVQQSMPALLQMVQWAYGG